MSGSIQVFTSINKSLVVVVHWFTPLTEFFCPYTLRLIGESIVLFIYIYIYIYICINVCVCFMIFEIK